MCFHTFEYQQTNEGKSVTSVAEIITFKRRVQCHEQELTRSSAVAERPRDASRH